MSEMYLSIIIPVYNEEKRIGASLHKVMAHLSSKVYSSEIIVIDDGSSDETLRVTRNNLKSFPHQIIENGQNKGKGHSVKRGMLAAKGRYLLFTDADLSTPIEEVDRFLEYLENGLDVVVGSRALKGSEIGIHQSSIREAMGRIFNLFACLLTFRGIKDSQCGFKGFRREVAHQLFGKQKIDGFSFDVEILFLAQRLGYSLKEEPVKWDHSPQTRVNLFLDPLKMFLDIIKIRLIHFKTHS